MEKWTRPRAGCVSVDALVLLNLIRGHPSFQSPEIRITLAGVSVSKPIETALVDALADLFPALSAETTPATWISGPEADLDLLILDRSEWASVANAAARKVSGN